MSFRTVMYLSLAVATAFFAAAAPEKSLTKVSKAPAAIPPQISAVLQPQGFAVQGADGTVCELWLVRNPAVKAGFKPSLNLKYPFEVGELIGVLRVGEKGEFTDFRGQQVKSGVYTLRYGQQPQDGNHIGTSEVLDFLVAIPAANDSDPKPLAIPEKLHKASTKASGTNHPAIFSLLPAETPVTTPGLVKDDANHWVLSLPIEASADGRKVAASLRLIVIGKAEG